MSCETVKSSCGTDQPLFFYDFSAPYCYLSAFRLDDVLPAEPSWQPIVFGALMGAIGKVSWTLRKGPARDDQMRECEQRAADLGLPLVWPNDWPFGTYSTLVVRAAVIAGDHGMLKEFSLAAYEAGLGRGGDLSDLDVVLEAAASAGLDPDAVKREVDTLAVKQRVRDITANAVRLGVTGVPAVVVGARIFWGDDQLEDAARFMAPAPAAIAAR
ncbi:MAG: 2-hydroxychromene-2-carboxylate isomerase [Solirubrobacteraceae bacterium]